MEFFEIPNGHPVMNTSSYLVAVLVCVITSLIIYITGRRILHEKPAEALRTEIPNVKSRTISFTRRFCKIH